METINWEEIDPVVYMALWVVNRHEEEWRELYSRAKKYSFIRRAKLEAKTRSLIGHDRILTHDISWRGLPERTPQGN